MKDWEAVEADVDKILSVHYTKGRGGRSVDKIVVHYNAGNLTVEGCYSVWQTRAASAHYQVESSGRIGQLVWDRDTAWHAGDWNANQTSIGIEHANLSDGTITNECLDNGAHLVAALCKSYGLGRPEWLKNVFPHKYFSATSCPGQIYGSQKDAYIQRAQYWYDVMTAEKEPEPEPVTPLPEALKGYEDLDPDAWYIPAVEYAVSNGYMGGYDASHFGPDDAVTRGQAVCILANMARADLADYFEPFEDVDPEPYYYAALCWALDNGYVDGEQTQFRPDDACTRAEFAAFNWRYAGSPVPVGEPSGYADWGDVQPWAHDPMAWAVEQGYISGTGNKLLPNDPCTRAQAAQMVQRMTQ